MSSPLASFLTRDVPPLASLYVRTRDRIRIRSFCSLPDVILAIHGLMLTPDGNVHELFDIHTPNDDRSEALDIFPLSEGFLFHSQVIVTAGDPRFGQCWVELGIVRGSGGTETFITTLLSDYVTNTTFPTFPRSPIAHSTAGPGAIESVLGTDPPVNTEILEIVPVNARWKLHTFVFEFVAAAGGAERTITVLIDDGVSILWSYTFAHTVLATETHIFQLSFTAAPESVSGLIVSATMPTLPLSAGFRISTTTVNLAALDNFSAPQMLLKEWIED